MSVVDEDDQAFVHAGEHEVVALLRAAIDIVANARPLPLSSSVRIEPDEVLNLLDSAVERLPEQLRQARWLLKERKEFLDKVHLEGDAILEEARTRAEKMVARQEIVRQAKKTATTLVTDAEEEARRKKHEAEDWCDQHLARFEIVLDRTVKTVANGRAKLRNLPLPEAAPGDIDHGSEDTSFFDQDT
jgi:vacuolar-type H+-ATPase subunit H